MNEKIPTKFLKLKHLVDVPRSEYMDGPSPKDLLDAGKRKSFLSMLRKTPKPTAEALSTQGPVKLTFNAAAWMRVPDSSQKTVSLVICYKDRSGEYAVVVDEADIGADYSLMLSGCVTIESDGTPEYIKACCAGISEGQLTFVDELHVQKLTAKTVTSNTLKTA
ncbi:hypothetical protein [Alkalimarinus alittae]|uniref:Uncharacterized protein n=1 Tax=Alkalimarinus alittae TaxID=2961619 RepID=A0ABY6N1V3_9ALTE|nr:hypothetical protein [Alkalimarinus alittae]UZE96000.1 hypothetical protein NKI27_18445 [Alkalimarinus alittae]